MPLCAVQQLDGHPASTGTVRNQTGNNAWGSIIRASASLKRGDYFSAAQEARNALLVCKDLDSVGNILLIQDISARLGNVGYKHEFVEESSQELARYSQVSNSARKSATTR